MSRPFLRILVTAFAILGFVGVPVAGQVTLSFASIPEQTLPGIPVNFRLTISSASAQPVILRNGALLEVTPENGAAFYVRSMGDDWYEPIQQASETEKWSDTISIQPASSRDYYWIVDCALTENAFFADRRLSKPGKYSLRIEVCPKECWIRAAARRSGPCRDTDDGAASGRRCSRLSDDVVAFRPRRVLSRGLGYGRSIWNRGRDFCEVSALGLSAVCCLFHATTTGGPVAWKLLSWTATATKDSKPCKGN